MSADDPTPRRGRLVSLYENRLFDRPLTPRRAARLIAGMTLFLSVAGAFAVRLLDKEEFHSLGDAFWFSLQTVTTVGYGDVVPERLSGRLVGVVLMLNGIAFLTVITASVTAMLIERARRRRSTSDDEVLARLDRIESLLAELGADEQRRSGESSD